MAFISQDHQTEQDVRTIVGGNFSPDALGPAYQQILARARAAPQAYLDTFERLFVTPAIGPRSLSNLHLPSFLALVGRAAPERARALAASLLRRYDASLSVADHAAEHDPNLAEALPEETSRFVRRLDQRRQQLRALLDQSGGQP